MSSLSQQQGKRGHRTPVKKSGLIVGRTPGKRTEATPDQSTAGGGSTSAASTERIASGTNKKKRRRFPQKGESWRGCCTFEDNGTSLRKKCPISSIIRRRDCRVFRYPGGEMPRPAVCSRRRAKTACRLPDRE